MFDFTNLNKLVPSSEELSSLSKPRGTMILPYISPTTPRHPPSTITDNLRSPPQRQQQPHRSSSTALAELIQSHNNNNNNRHRRRHRQPFSNSNNSQIVNRSSAIVSPSSLITNHHRLLTATSRDGSAVINFDIDRSRPRPHHREQAAEIQHYFNQILNIQTPTTTTTTAAANIFNHHHSATRPTSFLSPTTVRRVAEPIKTARRTFYLTSPESSKIISDNIPLSSNTTNDKIPAIASLPSRKAKDLIEPNKIIISPSRRPQSQFSLTTTPSGVLTTGGKYRTTAATIHKPTVGTDISTTKQRKYIPRRRSTPIIYSSSHSVSQPTQQNPQQHRNIASTATPLSSTITNSTYYNRKQSGDDNRIFPKRTNQYPSAAAAAAAGRIISSQQQDGNSHNKLVVLPEQQGEEKEEASSKYTFGYGLVSARRRAYLQAVAANESQRHRQRQQLQNLIHPSTVAISPTSKLSISPTSTPSKGSPMPRYYPNNKSGGEDRTITIYDPNLKNFQQIHQPNHQSSTLPRRISPRINYSKRDPDEFYLTYPRKELDNEYSSQYSAASHGSLSLPRNQHLATARSDVNIQQQYLNNKKGMWIGPRPSGSYHSLQRHASTVSAATSRYHQPRFSSSSLSTNSRNPSHRQRAASADALINMVESQSDYPRWRHDRSFASNYDDNEEDRNSMPGGGEYHQHRGGGHQHRTQQHHSPHYIQQQQQHQYQRRSTSTSASAYSNSGGTSIRRAVSMVDHPRPSQQHHSPSPHRQYHRQYRGDEILSEASHRPTIIPRKVQSLRNYFQEGERVTLDDVEQESFHRYQQIKRNQVVRHKSDGADKARLVQDNLERLRGQSQSSSRLLQPVVHFQEPDYVIQADKKVAAASIRRQHQPQHHQQPQQAQRVVSLQSSPRSMEGGYQSSDPQYYQQQQQQQRSSRYHQQQQQQQQQPRQHSPPKPLKLNTGGLLSPPDLRPYVAPNVGIGGGQVYQQLGGGQAYDVRGGGGSGYGGGGSAPYGGGGPYSHRSSRPRSTDPVMIAATMVEEDHAPYPHQQQQQVLIPPPPPPQLQQQQQQQYVPHHQSPRRSSHHHQSPRRHAHHHSPSRHHHSPGRHHQHRTETRQSYQPDMILMEINQEEQQGGGGTTTDDFDEGSQEEEVEGYEIDGVLVDEDGNPVQQQQQLSQGGRRRRRKIIKNRITNSREILSKERYSIDLLGRRDRFIERPEPPIDIRRTGRPWEPPMESPYEFPQKPPLKEWVEEDKERLYYWKPVNRRKLIQPSQVIHTSPTGGKPSPDHRQYRHQQQQHQDHQQQHPSNPNYHQQQTQQTIQQNHPQHQLRQL